VKQEFLKYSNNYINRWIISYADFVTMLLAIFMVMYALSQMDVKNMKQFSRSVGAVFDVTNKKQAIKENDLSREKLEQIFKTSEAEVSFSLINTAQNKESTALMNYFSNIGAKLEKETKDFEKIKILIKEKLNKNEGVSVSQKPRGVLIRLNNRILFDQGSVIIKKDNAVVLDKIAKIIKDIPNNIKIEGHTDNVPVKTTKIFSNWELSTLRAVNIINYLIKNHNISPARFSAVGYGEFMPVADNKTEAGKSENRRVDIVILSETSNIFNP
jgi:chemotaxis protein MotB